MIQVDSNTNAADVMNSEEFRNCVADGYLSIGFRTFGFWSSDHVTIYVSRRFFTKDWDFRISSSSGGRDTGEVLSDAEAYLNLSNTLRNASLMLAEFEKNKVEFDRIYLQSCADIAAKQEAEKKEKQDRIDRDPEMNESVAKKLIGDLKNNKIERIEVFDRGSEEVTNLIRSTVRPSGQVHFITKFGSRLSYSVLLDLLKKSSIRTNGV